MSTYPLSRRRLFAGAGFFDTRPRSLRFRFVTAMAGALGIGADIRAWTPEQRAQAAAWIAEYKQWRVTLHQGDVHLIGSPEDSSCGVQYSAQDGSHAIVLAWNSGALAGLPFVPGRPDRLRLRALDPAARYRNESTGAEYSGAHLMHAGLPCAWTSDYDADAVELRRCLALGADSSRTEPARLLPVVIDVLLESEPARQQ